jgi:ribosome-associated protein
MPKLQLEPDDYDISFVRAAGPGGQNVNKVATAAQLRFNVARYPHLNFGAKERLRKLAGRRLTDTDDILIIARNNRTQEGNRREALSRLEEMIDQALPPPIPRLATRPTRASKERRLVQKSQTSQHKKNRGKVRDHD